MRAIETEYGGVLFRSRLEAKWAVFFDALGVRWEYEPEGFELSDGTRYLPDFLVAGLASSMEGQLTFVEVKPIDGATGIERAARFADEAYKEHGHTLFIVRGPPDLSLAPYPWGYDGEKYEQACLAARRYRFWEPR